MASPVSKQHRRWIAVGSSLALPMFMFTIDVSIVNVALPLLGQDQRGKALGIISAVPPLALPLNRPCSFW
ncbi:MAG: hypothetical protein P3X23_002795 [Thermosynechococcus sp. Uc]|uniref:hypothetical protein n=1 Tax=Thermosynechococcus sp. Uc TaxID=3034853 RepID=UPI0019E4BADB|nr:hypothetical protein [Thermosynechococcus sp. Uc]MDM7326036.1 hypothetical protein [Thermosynechococcus sp. Uc]HIK24325.1 hypothetical protein [Thermosynechococcus sp. M46_R2017_013]